MRARRITTAPVPLAVAALVLVAPVAPASAGWGGDGASAPPPVDTGPVRQKVRACRLYASPAAFGLSCGKVTSGVESIRDILNGEPLPHCWHEPIPADLRQEYAQLAADNEAKGMKGAYWMEICLEGIDPVTLQEIDEVGFTQEPVWIPEPEEHIDLTPGQRRLVAIEQKDAVYPSPLLATSPTVRPRVGQDVAFFLPQADEVGPLEFVRGGRRVAMRARIVHLSVVPEPGAKRIECAGGGIEVDGDDTPASRPEACWYKFEHSSAGQDDNTYRVHAMAYWVVEYQNNGAWIQMATFEKEADTLQAVTEVQTVVVG